MTRTMLQQGGMTLLSLVIAGCAGYVPGGKAYWDDKVRELCAKDGGVVVYEKVLLSREEYQKLGGVQGTIPIPEEPQAGGAPYFARTSRQELHPAKPRVFRYQSDIIRRADSKVLGRFISYSRVGGGIPTGLGHDSVFSCRDVPNIRLDVERQVFQVTGDPR